MVYEIDSVTFGVISDDDVIGISACLVTKNLYDPRMGPVDNGLCVTCGKTVVTCPGHFGHIRLAKPIFHPLFIKKLLGQLKSTCAHCVHTKQHFCLSSVFENIQRVLSLKDVPYKKLSGRTLMSLILPRYFSLETDTVKIYDGVIYDGFVDKTTTNRIVKTVHNTWSNLHAADLIDNMQYITRRFLLRFGFTIGLDDCETTAVANEGVEPISSKPKCTRATKKK